MPGLSRNVRAVLCSEQAIFFLFRLLHSASSSSSLLILAECSLIVSPCCWTTPWRSLRCS